MFCDHECNDLVLSIEEAVTREYNNNVKLAVKRKHDEMQAYRELLKSESRNGPYMWITVNANPSVEPEMLLKACKKAFTKSWISHSIWALEQRSESLPYSGYHVHAIVHKGDKPPYDSKRGCKTTLSHVCEVENGHCLYIRYLDDDQAREKVLYLLGHKRDSKMIKVQMDISMRENLGIPPYFVHNVLPQNLLEAH